MVIELSFEGVIASALKFLYEFDVVDLKDEFIVFGYYFVEFLVDVWFGKMMLYGVMFLCLDFIFIIVVGVGFCFFFLVSMDKRDEVDAAKRKIVV